MNKFKLLAVSGLTASALFLAACDKPTDDPGVVVPNPTVTVSVSPSVEPSTSVSPSPSKSVSVSPSVSVSTKTSVDPEDCAPDDENCPDLPGDGN